MVHLCKLILVAVFLLVLGCGSAHDEHLTGPYRLVAVDVDEQMSISYDLGNGSTVGRINETVFAYGYNHNYIVAKQHPKGDKRLTNYYYLDITKDSLYASPSASVTGPLSKAEFDEASRQLTLPGFTKTIKHLE
jgi:hypothetical protein